MPVVKRYSNRKLYDTDAKRYVTLEDLAEAIRRGEEVHVVDHSTGEDLTSVTLMQVIFEEEKRIGGLMPQVYLTRLIRAGGSTVAALRSRLAALDPFQVVDEEIRRRMDALVEEGRMEESEAARLKNLLIRRAPPAGAVSIPVRGEEEAEPVDPEEVLILQRQVEALEQQLENLRQSSAG